MPVVPIADLDDARLAPFRDVGDASLRRERGECLVEGRLVVRQLLRDQPERARAVLVTEPARAALADLLARVPDLPVFTVPLAAMQAVTGFNLHRGCLAVASRGPDRDWRSVTASAQRLLVLEGVGNPDNVGGLFRTARAFGVAAVLLGPGAGDPLYRKAIRVSCGASLVVPHAEATPWPEMLTALAGDGVAVWALTPVSGAVTLQEACAAGVPDRLALLVGAEGDGLSEASQGLAHLRVRIPIAPDVDSLNVVVAAGIALAAVGLILPPDRRTIPGGGQSWSVP
jgi:tRNA G18 (ribose-2'-O)-methylase SpoU